MDYGKELSASATEAPRLAKAGLLTMKLEEQDLLTNQLNEKLENLFNRLQPVWQSPPQKPEDPTSERPESPAHISQVARNNSRIITAIAAVNLMIEGLEV